MYSCRPLSSAAARHSRALTCRIACTATTLPLLYAQAHLSTHAAPSVTTQTEAPRHTPSAPSLAILPVWAASHLRRLSSAASPLSSSSFSSSFSSSLGVRVPLSVQRATLFANAKHSFARGTEEEKAARNEAARKASEEFLKKPVDGDGGNAPRAREVENQFPTLKQLNEELPSAAELEQALREGKMDAFTAKPEKEED